MERLCARLNWPIASVYEDNGYSGMTNDRPGLKRMLRDAAKGEFLVVVVWDVSRLTRSDSGLMNILSFLSGHGVGFCIASLDMECLHADGSNMLSLTWKAPKFGLTYRRFLRYCGDAAGGVVAGG